MRIGITFDVKDAVTAALAASGTNILPQTDDALEEFDSPVTIEAIASAIRSLGHEVVLLGDGEPLLRSLMDPAQARPELVFNIAEGVGVGRCREARVPAVLEMLGIPYSGSDPLTLAVTLDKEAAKTFVANAGVAVPRGVVVDAPVSAAHIAPRLAELSLPVILKPCYEGSSKGINRTSLIQRRENLGPAIERVRRDYRQPVLVEEFIDGDEITVGLVGHPLEVIGIMRVLPKQPLEAGQPFVYSIEVKRDWQRLAQYETPAQLPVKVMEAIRHDAINAARALGCRDLSRIDFRIRDGVPYFIEVNPLPGLNPLSSDMVILATAMKFPYATLIQRVVEATIARHAAR